jgi:hypothetical protein
MLGIRRNSQRVVKGDSDRVNTLISERSVIDGVMKLLFIGGEWQEAAGGDTMVISFSSYYAA